MYVPRWCVGITLCILTSALDNSSWLASSAGPLYIRGNSIRYPFDRIDNPAAVLDLVVKTEMSALAINGNCHSVRDCSYFNSRLFAAEHTGMP
jgi:hypothetical protein